MAYVKWVANADRHNDWTTELVLEDGTVLRQGQPVDLKAELKKELEEGGRVFADSSKSESDEYEKTAAQKTLVGHDIAGTAPIFENAGPQNQKNVVDQSNDENA